MREGLFWLDDLQWSSIKGCLPGRKRRGPRRVDDRRVISGIIHVLQSGMRWRDCPEEYGPPTTIYNRWHRWSQQGLWQRMFKELSQIVGTHYENAIDSTAVKVHRSARGKRGPRPGSRHKSRRMHDQSPRGDRPQRPPFALSPERRPMLRWQGRRAFAEALARRQRNCWLTRLTIVPRSALGCPGAAPLRSFPTKSIAANLIPTTSEPTGTATRLNVCSAVSKTPGASQHATTNPPTTSSARSASSL